jgi:hypothetical protein
VLCALAALLALLAARPASAKDSTEFTADDTRAAIAAGR